MSPFERDLRESLRRKQPPPAFAARVLARTEDRDVHRVHGWRWLTAIAMVLLMAGGMVLIREQRRQSESERAKQQLLLAFRITGSKVRDVQSRLAAVQERIGIHD
jgi:hypothetical protein